MVEPGVTTSVVPEPTNVPPQLPEYQSTVHPDSTLAVSVEDWPEFIEAGLAAVPVGAAGPGLAVTVTGVPQPALPTPVDRLRALG